MQRAPPGRARRSDHRSARTPPADPLRVRRAWRPRQRCRVLGGSDPRTVAPGPATGRVPRRGTTSTEPREPHEQRTHAPRPTACGRRPRSLPEEAGPLISARPPLRHKARVVQAHRAAAPVVRAPHRCDRDRRPSQEPPATGPSATERPRPLRLRDRGITGWAASEGAVTRSASFPCRCQRRSSSGPRGPQARASLRTSPYDRVAPWARRLQASEQDHAHFGRRIGATRRAGDRLCTGCPRPFWNLSWDCSVTWS